MTPNNSAPAGVQYFKLLAIWGAVAVYLTLWITFYVAIWKAGLSKESAPKLSSTAVYVTSVLGATLAGFFGSAVGIQRKDPAVHSGKVRLGATLIGAGPVESSSRKANVATAAFWAYGVVGAWSLLTVLLFQVQSPHEVKALAAAFAGIVVTLLAAALAPGGGATQLPAPPVE